MLAQYLRKVIKIPDDCRFPDLTSVPFGLAEVAILATRW